MGRGQHLHQQGGGDPQKRAEGVDVDYEFGQVSIDLPIVGKTMNCGNISSAVGPFAIDEGPVEAVDR